MKNVGKSLVHILLSLVLIVFLCGCSPQAKSENEILQDIAKKDPTFAEYDLIVESHTISKRQTNKDQKTDYVWITVYATCPEFSYTADYTLEYVLYNDGWLLEDYYCADYDYTGNSSTIQQEDVYSDVVNYLPEGYDDITFLYQTESKNNVTYYYSAHKSISYFDVIKTIQVPYSFSWYAHGRNQWSSGTITDEITSTNVDMVGTWICREDGMEWRVDILSTDASCDDGEYVKCDFTYTYAFSNIPVYWSEEQVVGRHPMGWDEIDLVKKSERKTFEQSTPSTGHFYFRELSDGNMCEGYENLLTFHNEKDWLDWSNEYVSLRYDPNSQPGKLIIDYSSNNTKYHLERQ